MLDKPLPWVTIVSGLPRSGTSLMMQMLSSGGIPALTDQIRAADDDNPRGYFEFERVKQIRTDKSWLDKAMGKVVKMVHLLLMDLPLDRDYRVVFMRRDLDEVLASQRKMLERSGRPGAQMSEAILKKTFQQQVETVTAWLAGQPRIRWMQVHYADLISNPAKHAGEINAFLDNRLDVQAMAQAVDSSLYRNRR